MTTTSLASSFQEILRHSLPNDAFYSLRTSACKKFQEMGLPDSKNEAFRYFPVHAFYGTCFDPKGESSIVDQDLIEKHLVPECQEACLVFVDGIFRKELSITGAIDSRVAILSFEEATKTFGYFLQTHLNRQIKEEKDPFALAHLALRTQGAFLYIPPKTFVPQPIQVLHISTQNGTLLAPHLQVFAGAHANVKLLSTCACQHDRGLVLSMTDVAIEEGARLLMAQDTCAQSEGWHMDYVRVGVKKDGFYSLAQITRGPSRFRREIKVDLHGENAEVDLSGLSALQNQEISLLRAVVNHEAPRTRSSQHFKGVLSGRSRSSVEGKIIVQKAAQKTEAYQLCNHLLLNDHATANTQPRLEIFADDVKASHGATISQLKAEEFFYLHSRGIDHLEAKHLLLRGFCEEIISKLFLPSQRTGISQCLMSMH